MKKVDVVYSACYGGDAYPFGDLGNEVKAITNPDAQMTNPNAILVVWGGADINPKLYGHEQSKTTHPSASRDPVEWACIQKAIELGIPMIGVCRGAQMMCAAAGGFLIQDVSGHHGQHTVTTYNGSILNVNSIHHQMLAGLEKVDHELLAWSTVKRSGGYIWKDDQSYVPPVGFKEPELVYFPRIKAMAVQWHPEMMSENSPATTFIMEQWYARTANINSTAKA